MRHLLILLTFLLGSFGTIIGQDIAQSQVPQAILTAFSEDFSNARDVEWERKETYYEVEFDTRWGRDHEAWYDENGNMLYHKEEIPNRELPQLIVDIVNSEFEGYKVDDADKITEGEEVRYLIALDARRMHDIDLLIREDGEIISEVYDD
ncbi:MAG: PepSY-like domain-containing protein [Balneolales bacterium]